jgi:cell division protein FtsW
MTRRALPRTPAYVVVVATVAVLNVVGLVMILSASSVAALSSYGSSWHFFNRQLMWAAIGGVAFVVASRVDYRRWRALATPMTIVAIALLVLVLVPRIGIYVDGARRWLGFGAMRFQPSEVAKLALVLFCADKIATGWRSVRDWRAVTLPVLLVLGVMAGLVLVEPDLDSTIVLAVIALTMLAVGGAPWRHLFAVTATGAVLATYFALTVPYRRARVFSVLDPFADAGNTGYQLSQSLIALGSGGVGGVGLGAGRAKWMFLPNAHTDFIFAIVGEELGLVGTLLVVGLFACFGLVGVRVALRAPDRFGMLLCAGITAWVVGQAMINLGAVIGLLPVSGIPLPFLSAGGSSLVFTMTGAGILANVARRCRPAPKRPEARTAHAPAPSARPARHDHGRRARAEARR